jgi:signal transduction histidine kinase
MIVFNSVDRWLNILNWSNKLGFFLGSLTLLFLYRISRVFPINLSESKLSVALTVIGLMLSILSLDPLIAGKYTMKNHELAVYQYGGLSIILGVFFVVISVASLKTLLRVVRSSKFSILQKRQAKTILIGILATAFIAVTSIIFIPLLTGKDEYLIVGYFSPFIFTLALLYSILRQGFLNFRLIIIRSMAYIASLIIVGSLFATLAFYTANRLILKDVHISFEQEIVYTLLAILLGVSFYPLKLVFDDITRSIFYRDKYKYEDFLNLLGKELSKQIDLSEMLNKSLKIIIKTFNIRGAAFVVLNDKCSEIFRRDMLNFTTISEISLGELLEFNGNDLVSIDDLEPNSQSHIILDKYKIELILRIGGQHNTAGYLLIDSRNGGNPFTNRDKQILKISSKQLDVAIKNARHVAEIASFNETLQKEIKNATKKLKETNDKLVKLDEAKDEFVSMASHQLRTPLTTVKGYLSMLEDGDAGKLTKDQKKFVAEAYTSAQRMVYLISDLLNVSRINTGKFIINNQPTKLDEVIDSEVNQLMRSARAKDIDLIYLKPDKFPLLNLDEQKIRQVIMNFIDNAIYYTPSSGKIEVHLSQTKNSIEFKVVDNGIGVPTAQQHELFGKFFRASNAKNTRPDGTGLGIFMAKKVVVAEGGSIIFKSKENQGSTFGFVFPKEKVVLKEPKT